MVGGLCVLRHGLSVRERRPYVYARLRQEETVAWYRQSQAAADSSDDKGDYVVHGSKGREAPSDGKGQYVRA